jgi:hypothetical protein
VFGETGAESGEFAGGRDNFHAGLIAPCAEFSMRKSAGRADRQGMAGLSLLYVEVSQPAGGEKTISQRTIR